MSVLVSTAYMEEAERFDWLVAMDAGRRPRHRHARTSSWRRTRRRATWKTPSSRCCPRRAGVAIGAFAIPPAPRPATASPPSRPRGLTRRFGDFTAVDHVSFRIERGEIFGFLGSNGCGKTTTMKMLTGLLPATEGHARLFGRAGGRRATWTAGAGSATCRRPSRSTES